MIIPYHFLVRGSHDKNENSHPINWKKNENLLFINHGLWHGCNIIHVDDISGRK